MITLKNNVIKSAKLVKDYQSIKTEIGGGMHPKAAALWGYLFAIQEANNVCGDLLEIGVYKGWGSYLPAKYCRDNEKVVLIDIAKHHLDWAKSFLINHNANKKDQLETLLVDSAVGMGLTECLPSNRRFRWVHIDGEHSYAAVIADLDSASKYALSEAIICMDDVDYDLAPAINDAMQDWLKNNKSWRLLIRGFNKAYIVSTRSSIRWFDFVSFLPDVFVRYFDISILLASQTKSADSAYFSYGEPFDIKKYLVVSRAVEKIEDFEGSNPRTMLLGVTRQPNMLVFGNGQMRVLHGALIQVAHLCGIDVNFEYVKDVHELDQNDAEKLRETAKLSMGMICQTVVSDKFLLRTNDLITLMRTSYKITVPSMHFNAYWPNHADLQITQGSLQCSPTDGILYKLVEEQVNNEEIIKYINSPIYTEEQINAWHLQAIERLKTREVNNINVRLSDFLMENAKSNRLFYLFNHPGKQVFDFILRGILVELCTIFEARNRAMFSKIVSGEIQVSYDMSYIDFIDVPPIKSVSLIFGWQPNDRTYRYWRPRGTHGIHSAVSLQDEINFIRNRYAILSQEQKDFNSQQIKSTTLQPAIPY